MINISYDYCVHVIPTCSHIHTHTHTDKHRHTSFPTLYDIITPPNTHTTDISSAVVAVVVACYVFVFAANDIYATTLL